MISCFECVGCVVFDAENGGGIDINQPATAAAEYDDNVMASSPHSTASTVTGKISEREFEIEAAAAAAGEMTTSSMEEEEDGGDADDGSAAARKKLRLTKEQAALLEDTFRGHNTLNPVRRRPPVANFVIFLVNRGYFRNT